jgi:hypothetical protein
MDFERMNLFEKRSSGREFNSDVANIASQRAVAKEY